MQKSTHPIPPLVLKTMQATGLYNAIGMTMDHTSPHRRFKPRMPLCEDGTLTHGDMVAFYDESLDSLKPAALVALQKAVNEKINAGTHRYEEPQYIFPEE